MPDRDGARPPPTAVAIMAAGGERPGHREVDMAEQDDEHHAGRDDAEEGADLELLQQVVAAAGSVAVPCVVSV